MDMQMSCGQAYVDTVLILNAAENSPFWHLSLFNFAIAGQVRKGREVRPGHACNKAGSSEVCVLAEHSTDTQWKLCSELKPTKNCYNQFQLI
jgi:hypothetical protein